MHKNKPQKDSIKRNRPGNKPLSEKEKTERGTVNLPASLYEKALERALKRNFSAYVRKLVEADLAKAI